MIPVRNTSPKPPVREGQPQRPSKGYASFPANLEARKLQPGVLPSVTLFGLATLNHSPLFELELDLTQWIEVATAEGYAGLAPDIFSLRAHRDSGASLTEVGERLASLGLRCFEISGLNVGGEAETQAELEELVEMADALGSEFMTTRVVLPVDEAICARVARCEARLLEVGCRLGLEFSAGSELHSIDEARQLIDRAGLRETAVVVDSWHFFRTGAPWAQLEGLPVEQLAYVQLSDGGPATPHSDPRETMDARQLPGQGSFDLERFAATLDDLAFQGAVCLEVLNAELRNQSAAFYAEKCLSSARQSLSR